MCLYCFFLLGVNFDIDTGFKYRDIYIYYVQFVVSLGHRLRQTVLPKTLQKCQSKEVSLILVFDMFKIYILSCFETHLSLLSVGLS